ncbi:transglutaminase domain-containing protein [Paenibacillus campinasensis]
MKLWVDKLSSVFFQGLTMLWIWIIGMQWVSFTETIWLDETTAVVIAALSITAIIEALIPATFVLRMLLQVALIAFSVHRILDAHGLPVPTDMVRGLLSDEASYLLPYLWFALAAWAIVLLIVRLSDSRRKILMIIAINVISFTILDSFTHLELWDETAWIAAAGMGWLVTSHFNKFRARFPQGWRHLSKSPFKIIANILVIFSLIILAGVNMPYVQPTLTDPYTAWRELSGSPLSGTSTTGTGSLLEVPTESTSGYGREDNNLGAGFNFDYSPVMTVSSDERSYWRGEVRTQYSGTGWADGGGRRGGSDVRLNDDLQGDLSTTVSTKSVQQTITMLSDDVYPVLFGAYAVSRIDSMDADVDPDLLRWVPEGSELHMRSQQRYPKSYTVTSEIPVIPVEELSKRTYEELYSGSVDDAYLQIPRNFPDRVELLAEEVTAAGQTPYEKVVLLQDYLQSNYTYTNSPDLSRKQSPDFVEGFLFEIREGYCDYFSTSMVMMARSLDIPARWVKGYAPGSVSIQEFMPMDGMVSMDPGMYTVTNADAHSWVEVYFGEYGWIPIEATPGFSMPILTSMEESEPVISEELLEEEEALEESAPAAAPEQASSGLMKWIVMIAAAIIALWGAYILWRMKLDLRFAGARLKAGKPLTPADKVIAETERWLRFVHRRGLVRESHETLRESIMRWADTYPTLRTELHPLLRKFESARYSPAQVQEDEWRAVQEQADLLKKSMKKVKLI